LSNVISFKLAAICSAILTVPKNKLWQILKTPSKGKQDILFNGPYIAT